MKRVKTTKNGDIFSVSVGEGQWKFFQLIAFDLTQLNSDVIRAFNKVCSVAVPSDLSEVIHGEVAFYAHCVTKWGLQMNLWKLAGHHQNVGSLDQVWFRRSEDYGRKAGEEMIKVSQNWYVWRVKEDFIHVGRLKRKHWDAEIGIVVTPDDVVERIKTGSYSISYPGFE